MMSIKKYGSLLMWAFVQLGLAQENLLNEPPDRVQRIEFASEQGVPIQQPSIDVKQNNLAQAPMALLAPDADKRLAPVMKALLENDYPTAAALIEPLLIDNPDLQTLFLAAHLAEAGGQPQLAIDLYREMLLKDAALARPRFELARLLFAQGDYEVAKHHFERLQGVKALPPEVMATVGQFLVAIARQRRYVSLTVALMPSDNVNQGVAKGSFVKDGKTFNFSAESRSKGGVGLQWQAQTGYRWGQDLRWFVDGGLQVNDYAGAHQDLLYANVNIGRSLWRNEAQQLSLAVGGHYNHYAGKQLFYGLTAKLEHRWQPLSAWRLHTTWQSQQLRYDKRYQYLSGWQHALSVRGTHTLSAQTKLYADLRYGLRQAESKQDSNQVVRLRLGAQHDFNVWGLSLGGDWSYGETHYGDKHYFFGVERLDKRQVIGLNVYKRDWSYLGFAPRLHYSHTNNQSNIPLHNYTANEAYLSLTKDF